jgi:hypothetical protein
MSLSRNLSNSRVILAACPTPLPPSALALVLALGLAAPACSPVASRCDEVCRRFVQTCQWNAWTSVDQCSQGCRDDLYRRDDAQEVLDCYERAADPATDEEAEAAVDAAIQAGFWQEERDAGTFDRAGRVAEAKAASECSPFEAVQCKVDAVLVDPKLPLLGNDDAGGR